MEGKHTPWKWIESVHAKDFALFEIRNDITDRLIADLPAEPLSYPDAVERTRSEAHLIAAAPDLLEACERALARLGSGSLDVRRDVREVLEFAIAKAKGE